MKRDIGKICIIIVFCLIPSIALCQFYKRIDLTGGVSAREFIHGGIRIQPTVNNQFGLYYGNSLFLREPEVTTYSLNHMYHFWKKSQLSERPVWYVRQGVTIAKTYDDDRNFRYIYVNLSGGKEFNITKNLGVNMDIGFIVQVHEKITWRYIDAEPRYNQYWATMPLIRFQTYLSF